MELSYNAQTKLLEKALESGKLSGLKRKWPQQAELLMRAMIIAKSSNNMNDLSQFAWLRPHPLRKDDRHKFERLSLSPQGRLRIELASQDQARKKLKELDYASPYAHVLEVSEHYGD